MSHYGRKEVVDYIKDNDVRFVRLAFSDIFGQQKNLSVTAGDMETYFEKGASFDASLIRGFMNIGDADLHLFPDPSTMTVLPWRPSEHGSVTRIFCRIEYADGRPFEGDVRSILKREEEELMSKGLSFQIGTESEFYLFKTDEDGNPTLEPMDRASYLDIGPQDRGENIRRSISLSLEEMGINILSSHHEKGPGQNEITFKPTSALEAADTIITLRQMVKMLAFRSGLFASFLPKPLFSHSGSGLHISISCNTKDQDFPSLERYVSAGILRRILDMQVFLNPISNSYDRLGVDGAPERVTYGASNRELLLRVPLSKSTQNRVELRLSDNATNPYLAFYLLIKAAVKGIEGKEEIDERLLGEPLSLSLKEAAERAKESDFIREVLPSSLLDCFIEAKLADAKRAAESSDMKSFARDAEFLST